MEQPHGENESAKVEELSAENEKLRREMKKQDRELRLLKTLLDRNRLTAEAKDNMSRAVYAKRIKLERYLNLLMESSPDIILLLNEKLQLVYCTNSFLKSCGISTFGFVSEKYYKELLGPYIEAAAIERLEAAFERTFEEKKTVHLTEVIDFSQRENHRNYSIQVTPMLVAASGRAEGLVVSFYDTTDLYTARNEAERASNAKSDFLATVSHEIRTPMNAIIGVSAMLKDTGLDERQMGYLKSIQSSSDVLLGLINDILDFSKIEAGRLELLCEYFSPLGMLQHLRSMFDLMFVQKGLTFTCSFSENLPEAVFGDEGRIRQILANILNNAFKYTEKGEVHFEAMVLENGNLFFSVRDTGIGIKPDAQTKLFDAFEQLDLVRNKKVGGTGLGLAITKRLCEAMGSSVGLESEYGVGSCFFVEFSLKFGAAENIPASSGEEAIAFKAPGAKILLVDDIDINLEIAAYMLSPYEVQTDFAKSGLEAIEKVKRCHYDMILMDHMMPEMDGVEASGIIKQLGGEASKIPIVAITANAVSSAVEMFFKNGFNGFLSKPMDESALAGCLLKWLPEDKIVNIAESCE